MATQAGFDDKDCLTLSKLVHTTKPLVVQTMKPGDLALVWVENRDNIAWPTWHSTKVEVQISVTHSMLCLWSFRFSFCPCPFDAVVRSLEGPKLTPLRRYCPPLPNER